MNAVTEAPTFEGKTSEEWMEEARRCYRERARSIEESDTDGFLSQWASGQMAQRYEWLAVLAEQGGLMQVITVQNLETGEVAHDTWHASRFYNGAMWLRLPDGSFFNESRAKDPRKAVATYERKGYREVVAKVPALLNHRSYDTYPDRDAEWIVDEEATEYMQAERLRYFQAGQED